ncbi:hypothetical protein [Streptomyces galilaeus]
MAIFSAGEAMAEAPMEEFLGRHVLDPANSTFAQDLRESMLIGYGTGNSRENQQGNRPETGRGRRPRTRKDADSDQS